MEQDEDMRWDVNLKTKMFNFDMTLPENGIGLFQTNPIVGKIGV